MNRDKSFQQELEKIQIHLVVDEVQDINPVQSELIAMLTGKNGKLTMVGDHRQASYGFRGARVEIIGELWEKFKKAADSGVVDLQENFRSTPRIIGLANQWAETIGPAPDDDYPGNGAWKQKAQRLASLARRSDRV